MSDKCKHEKRKNIYTHGKKSPCYKVCKQCGNVVSKNELMKEYQRGKRK